MRRTRASQAVKAAIGAFVAVWFLLPVYWGLVVSLTPPTALQVVPSPLIPPALTIHFYVQLLNGVSETSQAFLAAGKNSLIEALAATLITVGFATMAAYAFVRYRFRGGPLMFLLLVGTMSIPVYAVLIPLFQLISRAGLVDTYSAIVAIYVSSLLPLAIWILRSHIASLPLELEDAAKIDGASLPQMIVRVLIPLIAPGMVSTAIIVFLGTWAQFIIPLTFAPTLATEPITVLIPQFATRYTVNYGLQSAAGMLAIIPPVIIVVWLNRYLLSGLLAGASK